MIGVERIEVCRARMRPVAPAGERIAATVVRRPHHRSQRRPAVDCFGDPAEGGDVGWRLLGPRVPRPVHLVSEPHEDGDTATVEDGQPGGEGGRDRCGDSRQTGPRLQGEQQHPAGAGDLSGSLLDVLPRGGVEGQRHEDDVDRRCVAQPAGVVRDPVVAPVQADAEPHPEAGTSRPPCLPASQSSAAGRTGGPVGVQAAATLTSRTVATTISHTLTQRTLTPSTSGQRTLASDR